MESRPPLRRACCALSLLVSLALVPRGCAFHASSPEYGDATTCLTDFRINGAEIGMSGSTVTDPQTVGEFCGPMKSRCPPPRGVSASRSTGRQQPSRTLHLSRLDCVTSKYTEDRPTPLLADVDRRPTQVLLTYALPYVSQVFSHIQVLCVPCDVNLSRAATAQISGMTTVYVYVLGLLPEMEYNCIAKYFNSGSKYFNSGPNTSSECNGGQTVPANNASRRELRIKADLVSYNRAFPFVNIIDGAHDFTQLYEIELNLTTPLPPCCQKASSFRFISDGRGGFCYLQFGLPLGVYSGLAWLHDDPSYTIELQGTYEVSENDVYTTDLADISTLHLAKNISLRESMAFNVCSCYGIHRVTGYTLRAEMTNANKSMTVRRTAEDQFSIPTDWDEDWCAHQNMSIKFRIDVNYSMTHDRTATFRQASENLYRIPIFCPVVRNGSEKIVTVKASGADQAIVSIPRNLFYAENSTLANYDVFVAPQWRPGNLKDAYKATEDYWNPFEGNAENAWFVVGDGTNCNPPLVNGLTYRIYVRGYARPGVYVDTTAAAFLMTSPSDTNVAEKVVWVVMSTLVMSCAIAAFLTLRYLCTSGMACGARPLEWPCSGGESTDGPAAHLPALQRDSCSSRGAGGVPPPYSRCAFKSLVAGLPNEAACPALLLEFETLCALSGQHAASSPDRAARLPHNAYKNRYANIVPFDRNRVRLQGYAEDDDTANYINASFITGYSGRVEYIAAQGPKEETTRDFWCMVFEQRVSLIVMLTKLVEGDKVKCYEYYPKLADRFVWGDLALQCSVLTELPAYTLRTLVMSKGSERRVVHHLHFREWPDFGCPASATHVLHICTTVRRHAALFPGLMLVHCSAGVGRTGTLIAVDILVQAIKAKKKVDVFGVVMKLREQRQFMVQCQSQYFFVYKCLKEYLEAPPQKLMPMVAFSPPKWWWRPCPANSGVHTGISALKKLHWGNNC